MRYPNRGSRYSRTLTKCTYAPTLLVLRNTRSFTIPTSAGRGVPTTANANASAGSFGMCRSVAKWLSVPPGRMASSMFVPSSADAAAAIVPSPPAMSRRGTPSATRSRTRRPPASAGATSCTSKASLGSAPCARFVRRLTRRLTSAGILRANSSSARRLCERRRRTPASHSRKECDSGAAGISTVALRSSLPQPTRRPLNAAANDCTTTQYITCRYAKRCRKMSQVSCLSSSGSIRNASTAASQSTSRKTA